MYTCNNDVNYDSFTICIKNCHETSTYAQEYVFHVTSWWRTYYLTYVDVLLTLKAIKHLRI